MVALYPGVTAPELSPLDCNPRDWSHRWDHAEPPRKGEAAFVVMLVGVRRKARWQPRTLDATPPVVHLLGAMPMTWTRSLTAARQDCHAFNQRQLSKRHGVTLWALPGWGVCGYDETIQPIVSSMEGGSHA